MSHIFFVPTIAFLVSAGSVGAAPSTYTCPQFIPQASVTVQPAQPGWKPFVASPMYLNSAAPAYGPPERLGILRGDQLKSTKTSWTIKYTLEGPYPEGKWLRCDYGPFGGVALSKRLPDEIKECIVSGKKGPHAGENIVEITCS